MQRPQYMRLAATGLAALALAIPTAASAHGGYLHLSQGEKAVSRYLLRDTRDGTASGYRIYDCHRRSNRQVICSADEYDVAYSPIKMDGQNPDALGLAIVATARPHGWISVGQPDVQTAAFRTR